MRHDGEGAGLRADPDRLALVLPGGEWYTPARPLLHQARAVLRASGWTVKEIWWHPPVWSWHAPPWPDFPERLEWVRGQVDAALVGISARRLLLVGKSLGTLAAPIAEERVAAAIWLTPVLSEPALVAAIARSTAPALLIGGTADPMWDARAVRSLGHPFLEIEGADHSLETDSDPINSAEILKQVTTTMRGFVLHLDLGAGPMPAIA